ncbi:GNAT family N-acetyltransferase [Candidatus Thorarchaeota archaeon]|nr:MAG: GNAT family N-acetyltransferase [Candidatus Thorarchaeota archaeon]
MKIIESEDWSTYKSVWIECMKDYYWYQDSPVFDWNKDEELEEMESDFGKPGNVFLEAHEDGEVVGVFSFRYRGKQANLNRWEPTALEGNGGTEIHNALLKHALDCLSGKGVERTTVTIKYPVTNPDVVKHLLDLYEHLGFERYQPVSVDLVTHLDDIPNPPSMPDNISIDPLQGTNPENIGKWVVRAYGSTPEDLEIHEFDKSVTDYDTAFHAFKSIMGGRLGPSPSEFWKVALVDDEPAGFIGGFIKESKHKPVTGILGPLGVFPEFRRLGLGVFLISELFKSMKESGCEYSAVGTPANNRNAIGMYQKAGYKLNCHLLFLEMTLT